MLAFKWILRLAQWPMPIVLVLVRLWKDDQEFKDSLNCIIIFCIQKKKDHLYQLYILQRIRALLILEVSSSSTW